VFRLLRNSFVAACRVVPLRVLRSAFGVLQQEIDRRGSHWITAHQRPKATADFCQTQLRPLAGAEAAFAIVVQGPLIAADDYTLDSVRLYRRNCPAVRVIVSTWQDSDPTLLSKLRELGAIVVTSAAPPAPGILNVNYQIVSTRAGLERAAQEGAEFVLKTRSDQRAYAPGLDVALPALLRAFPPGAAGPRLRILAASNDTRLYVPFHLSDQLQCGHVGDLQAYWSAPLDTRKKVVDLGLPIGEMVRTRCIPEVYLALAYLDLVGAKPACSLNDWWDALANYFCIVENAQLDWHWPKYQRYHEYRWREYQRVLAGELVSFAGWLQLLRGARPQVDHQEAVLNGGLSAVVFDPSAHQHRPEQPPAQRVAALAVCESAIALHRGEAACSSRTFRES
jgi:hypothetical protein